MRVKKLMTVAVAVTCMVGGMVACGSKGGVPKAAANVATSKGFDTSKKISVVSREEGSGTRGAFIELFGVEEKDAQGKKVDHTTKKASITNATSVMKLGFFSMPYENPPAPLKRSRIRNLVVVIGFLFLIRILLKSILPLMVGLNRSYSLSEP